MDVALPPASEQMDFVLKFLDGRGLLGLRAPIAPASIEPARVERLEMEVPNLRFPFDLSGGAARFQSRRCRFREAKITVEEGRLAAWLRGRGLAGYGIERASLRIGGGVIGGSFEAHPG